MHSFINFLFLIKNRRTYINFFANIRGMGSIVRRTHKYKFKRPDLESLRKLAKMVTSPDHFRKRYGHLLSILRTDVDEGLINTLVQFYDPLYRCFTFPDYQLVPTLEEYSHWVGLPVLDKVPFHGLEPGPKIPDVAAALHIEKADIKQYLTIKGGLQCLPFNFLYQKATDFAERSNANAFETILAVLIYGMVLFPNIDNFVDMNAIQIFLNQNPVPTLLADTYFSIHDRTNKERGVILCCTPLLHTWITSHLPRPKVRPERLPWSEKFMALTPADVVWYNPTFDPEVIIDHCGEFNNVPLLGTRGGISYNPVLARRQFGYPMRMNPLYLILDRDFFFYEKDTENKKAQFVRAWHSIVKKDKNQLGNKSSATHESYLQWVINRATQIGMPYPLLRSLASTNPTMPSTLPPESMEEYRVRLTESERESATWKRKYNEAMLEMETMNGQLEQKDSEILKQRRQMIERDELLLVKDRLLDQYANKKKRTDFFSGTQSDSDDPSI